MILKIIKEYNFIAKKKTNFIIFRHLMEVKNIEDKKKGNLNLKTRKVRKKLFFGRSRMSEKLRCKRNCFKKV